MSDPPDDNATKHIDRRPSEAFTSTSASASRRVSICPSRPENDDRLESPTSPPMRLTRKRAASINTEASNDPCIEDLAPKSASTTPRISESGREQVCLCQPDPKIPRPRNAFILYRQHYQAQVVQQHPGLANPEISKIIGEQWREQPPDVKNEWKRLAEEEKTRHQQQYPDYRYQPRRAGKPSGIRPASSSSPDDPVRCPKCHGRYISTPSTPLTPFTPAFTAPLRNERVLPPFTPATTPPRADQSGRYSSNVMSQPRNATSSYQQPHRMTAFPQSQSGSLQLSSLRERDHEHEEDTRIHSPSPEIKRRRFNDDPRNYSSPVSYTPPHRVGRPGPPVPPTSRERGPLPGPNILVRAHHGGMMDPPPRPPHYVNSPSHQLRSGNFDESLRLPPLQTQLPGTSAPLARVDHERQPQTPQLQSQMKSVGAMVMTIPYENKIKVLANISPCLPPPGPSSPVHEVRGAVVAVEGTDKSLVTEVGKYLEDYLSKDPECLVKCWAWSSTPPRSSTKSLPSKSPERDEIPKRQDDNNVMSGMEDVTSTSSRSESRRGSEQGNMFIAYLDMVRSWHTKSMEIIKYITTSPHSPSPPPSVSPPPTTSAPHHTKTPRIPIALLPAGFSLTAADMYASLIPINDAYAPVDHWQWMATLWRGIVGPDITIFVKKVGNDTEGRDELTRYGGVEIRNDCAGIIIRVPPGDGLNLIEEKSMRRMGFEVLEAVRGIGGEDGGAAFRS